MIEPEFASVLKSRHARDLHPLADTALRLGRAAAGDPHPHRARARHRRAHRRDRSHHPATSCATTSTPSSSPTGSSTASCSSPAAAVRLLPEGGDHDPLTAPASTADSRAPSQPPSAPASSASTDRRPRALARRLPPTRRAPARNRRPDHRPRRGAHDPPRAPLRPRSTAHGRSSPQHLNAALALQDYAARSAAWALNRATGEPLAEQIHAALQASPDGLTRTQISDAPQPQPARRPDSTTRSAPSTQPAERPSPRSPPAAGPPNSGPRPPTR